MAKILAGISVIVFNVLLFSGIIWVLFWRNPHKLNARKLAAIERINSRKTSTQDQSRAIKRLSIKPFLFWAEGFFISREELWFDENFIYVFRGDELVKRRKFEEIYELVVTKTRVNNIRIWRIVFADEASEPEKCEASEYKFAPAASIFTPNFKEFLRILCEKNPPAVKTQAEFWDGV